jgi:hypothetical protein
MTRILPIAAFAVFAGIWSRAGIERPPAPSPDREIASFLPTRCRIYLEGTGVVPLLEQGLEHPFLHAVQTSALGTALLGRLPQSPERTLAAADDWLGRPLLPVLAELTRRGVGLGFDPGSKKTVLVALGRDADSAASGLASILDALERQFAAPGALDRPRENREGADLWTLGGEAYIARLGALLVVGNERGLVTDVLDLAADPIARGLFGRPGFAAHHAGRPASTTLWAWLELAEIEPHADQGFRELRAANRTPAVQGILGAEMGGLLSARALSLSLSLEGDRELELGARAFEAPCLTTLAPHARAGDVPAEVGGDRVAGALLYRDYARFFAQRAELFAPEQLPGFAEAITNGALFFGGKDLSEDVLPRLSPWIRLVSQEPDFAAERRPEIPLPGLAAVGVLDREEEGEQWVAAFQTLVALVNVDQAQKGRQSLRLRLDREGGVEITSARFATPDPGDGVDVRYNLEPAVAVVGRHLVLGTHQSLVRGLVRELAGAAPGTPGDAGESLALDAAALRTAVEQNRELLIAKKMLEDGLERDAAAREIEGLRLALASFEGARIELVGADPTAPELRLELRLALPEGTR